MGVQLNIKSAEARELAEKLASVTGQSLTEAVTEALRLQLERLTQTKAELGAKIAALSEGAGDLWIEPWKTGDHGDLLYDESGLPR